VFAAAIERRDQLLLDYLATPQTLDELVARRILYRPHVELAWVGAAERNSIVQHLRRLGQRGLVEADGRRWVRVER